MLQRPWAPLQADDASRVTQLLSQHCDLLWGGPGLRLPLVRTLRGVRQLLGPPNRDLHTIAMPSGGLLAPAEVPGHECVPHLSAAWRGRGRRGHHVGASRQQGLGLHQHG